MKIDIKEMGFGYTATPVLKGINLAIGGNQLVSILGPNGVGKSTLIHCINKILSPKEGVVLLNDVDVSEITIKDLAKEIGYVPYSTTTSFPLSVVDTVLMGRHPHSKWKTTDEDLQKVYETLDLLGIEHLAMRSFNQLSAGQHQKVMLARGLVQEPKVLLLDEPTANLDIKHQMEVARIMRDLAHEKGITVIMISHDINIAATYSDNVILMYEGSIFAVGTPHEVITKENIKKVYGVESEVVDFRGKPHLVLIDEKLKNLELPKDSYVSMRAQETAAR
ncbi:MAG: ABC transporter ATP-binding protein [Thermoplasmatales archaeon]|nr:ABC transporter ATP-binding protein [Thermoplasmatales archaeon]